MMLPVRSSSRVRAMILRILPFTLAASLAIPLTGCVARGARSITNVIPVPLEEGANLVPHLSPDGRQGLVVEARAPDAAAGTRVIMTMLPRAEGVRGWDVVEMDGAGGSRLPTIDGHGRSVVFARAKVGGMPATLVFVASPDPEDGALPSFGAPLPTPRRMVITTLRLQADERSARFQAIDTEITRGRYCSGTDALAATYSMDLPEDAPGDTRCAAPGA